MPRQTKATRRVHPHTRAHRRHDAGSLLIQKAKRAAVLVARLTKRATCHTFRHFFNTPHLGAGQNIRTVQALLGQRDVKTMMICTRVLNRSPADVGSPIDTL